MQGKLFLKPNPESPLIRDPVSLKFLSEEGEWKPKNSYWMRRVKMKDAIEATPQQPKAEKPKKKGD